MPNYHIHLFTINLWKAHQENNPRKAVWQGKLQSLPDGEAYYFRDWSVLIQHLGLMLSVQQSQQNEINHLQKRE